MYSEGAPVLEAQLGGSRMGLLLEIIRVALLLAAVLTLLLTAERTDVVEAVWDDGIVWSCPGLEALGRISAVDSTRDS